DEPVSFAALDGHASALDGGTDLGDHHTAPTVGRERDIAYRRRCKTIAACVHALGSSELPHAPVNRPAYGAVKMRARRDDASRARSHSAAAARGVASCTVCAFGGPARRIRA